MRKLRLEAAAVEKRVIMTRRINARHAFEAESRMRTRQLELLQQIEALLKRHGKRACHKVVSEGTLQRCPVCVTKRTSSVREGNEGKSMTS
jgi:hypothetical protein